MHALKDCPGTLIIIGGGGTPPMVHEEFFKCAGDQAAEIIHIPSATSTFHEIENKREYYCEFYDRSLKSFEFLHVNSKAEALTPGLEQSLQQATGVWIGGGNQNRLTEFFWQTPIVPAIRGVLRRGGVVAGTSSGASIMSQRMISFGYTEAELTHGFSLFPRSIVDPHFTQRERERRLAHGVLQTSRHFGVGVDEKVSLIVRGNTLRAIGPGEGSAWFYFAYRPSGMVKRYQLAIGETAELEDSAFNGNLKALQIGLRRLRRPEILELDELRRPEFI